MTQFEALKYNGEVNAGSEGTSEGEDKKEENPILQVSQHCDTGVRIKEYFKKESWPSELNVTELSRKTNI